MTNDALLEGPPLVGAGLADPAELGAGQHDRCPNCIARQPNARRRCDPCGFSVYELRRWRVDCCEVLAASIRRVSPCGSDGPCEQRAESAYTAAIAMCLSGSSEE